MDIYQYFFYNAAGLFTKQRIVWANSQEEADLRAAEIGKHYSRTIFNSQAEKERYKLANPLKP